jgi:hypothetical protein
MLQKLMHSCNQYTSNIHKHDSITKDLMLQHGSEILQYETKVQNLSQKHE